MFVDLNNIQDAKEFVALAQQYDETLAIYPIDEKRLPILNRGVDAKSILGVFSLDLSRPVWFAAATNSKRKKEIYEDFKRFYAVRAIKAAKSSEDSNG